MAEECHAALLHASGSAPLLEELRRAPAPGEGRGEPCDYELRRSVEGGAKGVSEVLKGKERDW